jgi:hypothetical protein
MHARYFDEAPLRTSRDVDDNKGCASKERPFVAAPRINSHATMNRSAEGLYSDEYVSPTGFENLLIVSMIRGRCRGLVLSAGSMRSG